MTEEVDRHRRLSELFAKALDLSPDQRDIWLESLEDQELAAELRELLATGATTGGLRAPVIAMAAAFFGDLEEGQRVGPYRLIERLGRGGMGEVWRASQSEPIEREVALKIMSGGSDELAAARFLVERQALARLGHRAVARIYDAGSSEMGRWVAIELIEGEPITVAADRGRLSLRRRVEWLAEVAQGIHHAHGLGVIHRDLKPANVLVSTSDQQPKIIDFGIARMDDQVAVDERSGTPGSMSPEQILGVGGDGRSDVFALGVLLFELLAGVSPWDESTRRDRLIDPTAVSTPSPAQRLGALAAGVATEIAGRRGLSPRAHRSSLVGELDWVLERCLAVEPQDRYASAAALSDDLQSWLAGRPIAAGPDSAGYRIGCFLRRHKLASAAALLAVAALVAGVAGVSVESDRARKAAAEANQAREEAEEVVGFLIDALHNADPGRSDPTASEIIERAGEVLEEGSLAPKTRSRIRIVLGDIHRQRGQLDRAEEFFREAITERRESFGGDDVLIGTTLDSLALIELDRGDMELASNGFDQALEILEAQLEPGHIWLAQVHSNRAIARMNSGRLEEAEDDLNYAIENYRSQETTPWRELARALNNLGSVWERREDPEQAERSYRESLAVRREHLPADDPELATSANNLAILAKRRGEIETARRLYREALDTTRAAWGPDHDRVAITAFNLGLLEIDHGGIEAAVELFEEARAIIAANHGESHPHWSLMSLSAARALAGSDRIEAATSVIERVAVIGLEEGRCEQVEKARVLMQELGGVLEQDHCQPAD